MFLMAVRCFHMQLVEDRVGAAEAFRDEAKISVHALVKDVGFARRTCEDAVHQHVCSAGPDIDALCHPMMRVRTPRSAIRRPAIPPVPSRRLRCDELTVPWMLVEFQLMNQSGVPHTFTRCAYRYGTFRNSEIRSRHYGTLKEARKEAMQTVNEAHRNAYRNITVWTQDTPDHCVVGFSSLDAYVVSEKENTSLLAPLGLFYFIISFLGCYIVYLTSCKAKGMAHGENASEALNTEQHELEPLEPHS